MTWKDKRVLQPGDRGRPLMEQLLSRIDSSQMSSTGCQLAPGYLGTILFALQQLGEFPRQTRRATFVADWIAAQFCQQDPVTDRSHAASSGIYDLQQDRWHETLMQAAEIDDSLLPDVSESGCVIGEVASSVASEIGISAGIPVCNAIGDNQAAVLSSLPPCEDTLLINIGTGGQIVWRIPEFKNVAGMDTRYVPNPNSESSASDHQFMLVGAGLCGGDAIAWINRTVREWLGAFGVTQTESQIWEILSAQIAQLPSDVPAVDCEPFFMGTRPEPQRRAVFQNVGSTNFTPANVALSILTGIAETMHGVFESSTADRPDPLRRIVLSGNGARKNPQLVSAIASRFRVPATVSPFCEEAATGAAMLAGVRIGISPDLSAVHKQRNDATERNC